MQPQLSSQMLHKFEIPVSKTTTSNERKGFENSNEQIKFESFYPSVNNTNDGHGFDTLTISKRK